jgi:hypothetical protein
MSYVKNHGAVELALILISLFFGLPMLATAFIKTFL